MDLATTYLGLELSSPFMPGASPLADDMDTVKRLEDAGAATIVMRSLFEEQIVHEEVGLVDQLDSTAESFAEARSFFPQPSEFVLAPDAYLEQLRKIKEAVSVPVVGSLNGTTPGGWLEYAGLMHQAGADALELNIHFLSTDPGMTAASVERRALDIVTMVREQVPIPLAAKLSPFYSALPNLAHALEAAGADGLVLFNRFYQPDIDVDALDVVPTVHLSDSSELLLRLRWTAILSGRIGTSLAITGGVHTPLDAVKAVMAGAHGVQLVSALLRHGPGYLAMIREGLVKWMKEHEYESLRQMQGSMNLFRCPDASAFERANYMRILQGWRS